MSSVEIKTDNSLDAEGFKPEAIKSFKLSIDKKSVSTTAKGRDGTDGNYGKFIGFASVYGTIDLQGDIVEKGAFARTLNHKDSVVTILWQHDPNQPIGVGYLEDSEQGLIMHGELNLEVLRGKEAYALLKQGALKGLSIGYDVVKDGYKNKTRLLKELRLWEVSLVTFPANPLAKITSVKSVMPFQEDVKIADPFTPWDAVEAKKRVKDFATKDGKFDPKTYAKAFLYYDENAVDEKNEYPEIMGAYKLPIADVVEGKLQIVPRALYTAAAVMMGSRGGVDIPEREISGIKSTVAKYYDKLEKTAPWDAENKTVLETNLYSIVAMSDMVRKKSMTDEEKRLVQIAIDALKQLIEVAETNAAKEIAEKKPEAAPEAMPYTVYELNDEDNMGMDALLAILDKIMNGKSLEEHEKGLISKVQVDLKELAQKMAENKATGTISNDKEPVETKENKVDAEVKAEASTEAQPQASILATVWRQHFIPALKSYGSDMETNGEMSEETLKKLLEVKKLLDESEQSLYDVKNVWSDFVTTLDEYGENVLKGDGGAFDMDKLSFLQDRVFAAEKKMSTKADAVPAPAPAAAAPAPAAAPAAAKPDAVAAPAEENTLDIDCPFCKAPLTVDKPAEGEEPFEFTCPTCKADFSMDSTAKLTVVKPGTKPATTPAAAAPAAAPAPTVAAPPAPPAPKSAEAPAEIKADTEAPECTCPKCKAKFGAEIDTTEEADTYEVECPDCGTVFEIDAEGNIPENKTPAPEEQKTPEKKEAAATPEETKAVEEKAAVTPATSTVTTEQKVVTEVPAQPESITVTPSPTPEEAKDMSGLDNSDVISDSDQNSLVELLNEIKAIRQQSRSK